MTRVLILIFPSLVLFACGDSNNPNIDQHESPDLSVDARIGIYNSTVVEAADDLEFVVSLSTPSMQPVSVDYATVDGSASAGQDYVAAEGTLVFQPGETRKFLQIEVLVNAAPATESSHSMRVELTNPQQATISVANATGTIIDREYSVSNPAFDHNWAAAGAFTNAQTCGESCHKAADTAMVFGGEDISPGSQWRHSVMAHSFTDPYWQAAVEDEVKTFPQLAGFIEETCLKCHAPMGVTHAHHTGSSLDADSFYRYDSAILDDHAREGVSCTLCHQVRDGNLGTLESFSGGYSILGDASDPGYKQIFGPYANPVGTNMHRQTGHTPVAGNHISESRICATCHTLYTPTLDAETGLSTGKSFLEQGPFLEWLNSDYATGASREARCQDCHMPEPETGYATRISLLPNNTPERSPYRQHSLLGGNAHLLGILRTYREQLGISASTSEAGFDRQIALTRDFLQNAASLSISAPSVVDDRVHFDVEVINQTGHKLPSSYPSRRMWLHVQVRDADGVVIFESGRPDSRGYLATDAARLRADCMAARKLDGFDSAVCYEPHRDVISEPGEVAIYESVLANNRGQITHTLLMADGYLKDNRIPPAGFTNSRASMIEPQTLPSGIAGDEDFNCAVEGEGCGGDTVHYQIDAGNHPGPYQVEARLLYQATQPAFVDGLHNHGDRIDRFKLMFDAVPPSVELLAAAQN